MNYLRLHIPLATTLLINSLLVIPVLAEPIYHPSGPKLTFGGATHRQMTVSDMGNPAHPAIDPTPNDETGRYGIGLSIGGGIEYEGNDNLFKLLNELGKDDALAPGDGSDPGGSDPGDGEGGINIGDIIGVAVGDLTLEQEARLEELLGEMTDEAIALGAFLVVAATDLNAKVFISADIPVLISNNTLGGAWTFGANTSITTNLKGLAEPINIDADLARQTLQDLATLSPTDPVTTFELGNFAKLTVDPLTGETTYQITNNSAVSTKAAQITEISVGYSRKVWQQQDNDIYVGIKPKYYDVGLSNTIVPIANITDAKSIFDALDKSNFKYSQGYGVDIGAIWTGKQYQIGATVTNLNEPSFNYPASDLSGFTNQAIIDKIRELETYTMKRQLKLEGGVITPGGAWGLNFGLDANAVPDPMRDDYQWASVGANFASDSWWLPGARLGARRNLAGSQLLYYTAGVTVFNFLNLDLATTSETITVDGHTVPRGLMANISMQVLF